jgi:hypothetical protein
MFHCLTSAGKWNTINTSNWRRRYLFLFTEPLLNLHIRDSVLQMLSNNYAYEVPHNVWASGKWNVVKQPTEKGIIVGLYFHLLSNFIWPLLNLHMHILCTWNAIKQLCLWCTKQCLSSRHLLASETRSNNQLKKALLLAFISIYSTTLFDHFWIYTNRDFVLEILSNNYAYEVPHKVWASDKWNAVKQPTKKDVIASLYFYLLSNFIWPF